MASAKPGVHTVVPPAKFWPFSLPWPRIIKSALGLSVGFYGTLAKGSGAAGDQEQPDDQTD